MKQLNSKIGDHTLEAVKVGIVHRAKNKSVLIKDLHKGYVAGKIKEKEGVITYSLEMSIPEPKILDFHYPDLEEFYVLDEE